MDLLRRATSSGIGPAAVRVSLDAALRAADDRIWVPRNVARIYREALGDLGAARGVLRQLAPLTCVEWRLSAAAWVELGDLTTATACLERAASNARTASDLCTIAMGYRDAGYLDEGRLLLQGADAIASRAFECWTVATTYDAFGDRPLARATLDRSLDDAIEVAEIVTLAHALAAYDADPATLERALTSGERRASTVRDWLELAIARNLMLLDLEAANRCVAQASGLATSPEHEREIGATRAQLYQLELLDDERPKLEPGKLLRSGSRTFGWDRDPARLLGWLRARLPRATIDTLTRPSQFFVNDDLVALLEISKTGLVPHPLPAYLELLRDVRWEQDAVDHLRRAFACTLLCIEDAAIAIPGGNEPTIAILLESCLALGPGAVDGAVALFAAMADAYDATHSTTRVGYLVLFAELGLVLAAAWLDPTDPRLEYLISRLIEHERRHRDRATSPRPAWLLGLTIHAERDPLWRSLAEQILVHPRHARLAKLLQA